MGFQERRQKFPAAFQWPAQIWLKRWYLAIDPNLLGSMVKERRAAENLFTSLGIDIVIQGSNSRPFVVGLGIRDHSVVQRRDQGNFDEAMKM